MKYFFFGFVFKTSIDLQGTVGPITSASYSQQELCDTKIQISGLVD